MAFFEQIVLVASPQVMGELRDKIHQEVSDKVVAENSKTLTNHPIPDNEKIVSADVAVDIRKLDLQKGLLPTPIGKEGGL